VDSLGEKLVHYPLLTREELLDRNKFNSPRPIRPTATAAGAAGTNLVNDPHRRNPQNPLPPVSVSGITSPPPPYQAAVNEVWRQIKSFPYSAALCTIPNYFLHNY